MGLRGAAPTRPENVPGWFPARPGQGGPQPATIGAGGELLPPAKPQGQVNIFPWWLYEMPGAVDWEFNALLFVAALNSTTDVPGGPWITVQPGYVGLLQQIELTVQNSLATIDLRLRLFINGAPIQGWGAITAPTIAATGIDKVINGMVVRMGENDKLTGKVIEASGTSYTVSVTARGWTVPENVVKQFQSGVPY
jgi:hypothetical protein